MPPTKSASTTSVEPQTSRIASTGGRVFPTRRRAQVANEPAAPDGAEVPTTEPDWHWKGVTLLPLAWGKVAPGTAKSTPSDAVTSPPDGQSATSPNTVATTTTSRP